VKRSDVLDASKIVYIEYIEVDGEGYEEGNADDIPVVFKQDIEAIPAADVVEVVRCKDCLYYTAGKNICESWEWCEIHQRDTGPYEYCSYGELKR